jgi:hypothetical protein
MRVGLSSVIVFICGLVCAETFHAWREAAGRRTTPPRLYALGMDDIIHAIPQLVGAGVYWFDGSLEDARQIKDVIDVLQPSFRVSVMKIDGVPDLAIINAQHTIFENGGVPLHEVEQKLLQLAPES